MLLDTAEGSANLKDEAPYGLFVTQYAKLCLRLITNTNAFKRSSLMLIQHVVNPLLLICQ